MDLLPAGEGGDEGGDFFDGDLVRDQFIDGFSGVSIQSIRSKSCEQDMAFRGLMDPAAVLDSARSHEANMILRWQGLDSQLNFAIRRSIR